MRRVLTSLLAASVLLLAGTFAGMAVFGMGMATPQVAAGCEGHGCHGTPEPVQASGMDCVEHCLSAIPAAVAATPASLAAVALLFVITILSSVRNADSADVGPAFRYFRDSIGKILLRRTLATVILRN